uniref:Phosphomevalonate dehydratase large subunit n=1 Tax=Geoglobus ahangari TaxID=113653 RepID=A0A7C3UHE7_9EURY
MFLSKDEEKLLESDNYTIRKCMEILVAIGKIFDADRLIEIKSAQVSGISYDNIGDAGVEWLESLNAKVKVPTLCNPAGMDLIRWREMGIDEDFYEKQMRVINALKELGVSMSLTCTPYYLVETNYGDHLAWAESSAIVYANSVIGARTNRESGITALASAIIGKTPNYGLHIKENRAPDVRVIVDKEIDPAIAGYETGRIVEDKIPFVEFKKKPNSDGLKAFGAALAASGGSPMFHAKEITPEWEDFEIPSEKIVIDGLKQENCEPDLIAIGCPHLSKEELKVVYDLLSKMGRVKRTLWIFTSRNIVQENKELVKKIESLGAKVFSDTCMVVSPATRRFECVMTNSGKALEYLPKTKNVRAIFGNLRECIEVATK